MVLVEVKATNAKAGVAVFEGVQELISDAGKNGLIYRGFVPKLYGPSGKLLNINLVFEEDIVVNTFKFEEVEADNDPKSIAEYNLSINDNYLGFYPIKFGPSGKLLKLGIVEKT